MKKALGLLTLILAITILISGCLDDVDTNNIIEEAIGGDIPAGWCVEGATWDYAGADADLAWEIVGEEQFKDATYCKIKAVSETEMLNATYYVSNNREDIWYVIELQDGTMQETHVVSPPE